MLEKQKDIDAVVIATPDHMHAPIACMAMDLGKHVYVQKPLCWSVEEARVLAKKAKDRKIVSQMGNQGHSLDDSRTSVEHIAAGTIGEIREVHVWTNRPLGYWPQGVPRPKPLVDNPKRPLAWSGRDVEQRLAAAFVGNYPMPERSRLGSVPRRARRRLTTIRFITRSTGAAGWIGDRARSATWERTSSIIRSGR